MSGIDIPKDFVSFLEFPTGLAFLADFPTIPKQNSRLLGFKEASGIPKRGRIPKDSTHLFGAAMVADLFINVDDFSEFSRFLGNTAFTEVLLWNFNPWHSC